MPAALLLACSSSPVADRQALSRRAIACYYDPPAPSTGDHCRHHFRGSGIACESKQCARCRLRSWPIDGRYLPVISDRAAGIADGNGSHLRQKKKKNKPNHQKRNTPVCEPKTEHRFTYGTGMGGGKGHKLFVACRPRYAHGNHVFGSLDMICFPQTTAAASAAASAAV